MKNFYYLKALVLLLLFASMSSNTFAQKGISKWIEEVRKNNKYSEENFIKTSTENNEDSELKKGKSLDIDLSKLLELWGKPRPTLMLTIPIAGRTTPVAVELARIQITTSDFKVSTNSALIKPSKIDEGVHYRGIVKGDAESVVAISIYKDEIRGFISDKTGKYEIGKVKNQVSKHVVYEEKDLKATQPFACGSDSKTTAKNGRESAENLKIASTSGVGCKTVGVYFECDYQMYLDNGSNVTNVTNYVTSFFNQVATLYQNENIDIQISQIYVWTTADPYRTLTTTSSVLQAFDTNRGSNYTGDLAHFLTTRNLGGGIAYVNTLCNKAYAHGVSMIYNTFATYPTFSWTVECVAHELGHNLGSNHTQWCGWTKPDGTTGPIDNCVAVEGTCAAGPTPTNGGTIMSYCHLTSVGINFANGFGTLPGNALRLSVTNATCLATNTSTAAAPTGQQTSNILTNGATLSWNAVPNVVNYSVDYKATSSTTWTTLGSFSTTATALTGLLAGTSYSWRVKGDCSSYSTTTTFVTTGTAPCAAPTGLASSNLAATTASLAWAAVSGATNYTIQYKTSGATTWTTAATVTTTNYALTGLTASTAYNWQVMANCSAYSTTANFSTIAAPCAAPTGLASSNLAATTATVAWSAVSGATNYVVQYKKSSTTTWTTAATVTTTNYNLTGLTASTAYNWQVKASCSDYSATANFSTIAAPCAAPTGLASSNLAATSATVAWAAVSGATNYTIQYKTSAATTWTTAATVTTTNYALTGLTGSTAYNWQVMANCSVYSTTANFSTIAAPCAAPTGLASSNLAATTATVAWSAVSGATNYVVQYKKSSTTTWTTAATVTTTSYALTGLVASTAYNWQVKANCSAAYAAGLSFTTTATPCAAPTGLASSSIAATTATLAWSAVSGATNYVVQYKTTASTTWIIASTVTTTTLSLTGLAASTAYDWQVKGNCSTSFSTIASLTTTPPPCAVVIGLVSSNIAASSATLAWSAVSGATNYVVQYKKTSVSTWTTAATVTTTSYNLTGLLANTAYNWQVKANCSAAYSASVSLTTTACSAPINLTTSNVSATSAILYWGAVGGATNYVVQYKKSTATVWTTAATVTTASYTLLKLTALTAYNWQVKANCSASYSTIANLTTTSATCAAPTGLVSSNLATTSISLAWGEVVGAANYVVQYKKSSVSTWTTAATVTSTNHNLTGLIASTAYNWQVKASCSAAYTAGTVFTTAASSCTTPTSLISSNISSTSATLAWGAVSGATNYVVQYKATASSTWIIAATATTTNYSLTGLTANTPYDWQVKANCSIYTTTANFSTPAAISVSYTCVSPTGLLITNIFPNSATLSWNTVSGADNYLLEYKLSTTTVWTSLAAITSNAYSLTGLTNGKNYDWRVKANCSDYSSATFFTPSSTNIRTTTYSIETSSPVSILTEINLLNINKEVNVFAPKEKAKFTLYPNPAGDNILLNITDDAEIEAEAAYRIIDFRGNVRKLQNIKHSSEKIDISNLENGTYIIQMLSKSGIIESKTLVKEE